MIGRQFAVSFWQPPNWIVNDPSAFGLAVMLLNE